MLPKQLNKIQDIADTCRDLANDVDEKFQGVMNLICELLEACAVAQKEYADKDEKTKAAIEVLILLFRVDTGAGQRGPWPHPLAPSNRIKFPSYSTFYGESAQARTHFTEKV